MTKQAQKKSKYNLWQNTGFMVRLTLKIHPGVIFICITLALSIAGGQVAELLFTPSLLQKLETGAPLPEVLLTIGLFCGSLLILNGLTAYLNKNTLYGRVEARTLTGGTFSTCTPRSAKMILQTAGSSVLLCCILKDLPRPRSNALGESA